MLLKRTEKRTVCDNCYSDCIPTVVATCRMKGAFSHKEYKKNGNALFIGEVHLAIKQ